MIASCGICDHPASFSKKFFCSSCASFLVLDDYIGLVNVDSEVADLSNELNGMLKDEIRSDTDSNETTIGRSDNLMLLRSRLSDLKSRMSCLKNKLAEDRLSIDNHRDSINHLKESNILMKKSLNRLTEECDKQLTLQRSSLLSSISELRSGTTIANQSLSQLQTHCCKELIMFFGITEKRRKKYREMKSVDMTKNSKRSPPPQLPPSSNGSIFAHKFDVFIGFSVLPDLSILPHYRQSTINTALERLAYFVALISHYLQIKLPYQILLPQRSYPHLRIAYPALSIRHTLFIENTHSIYNMVQNHSYQFEEYAQGLAMLALCLAQVANYHQIILTSPQEIVQVNKVISRLCSKYTTDALNSDDMSSTESEMSSNKESVTPSPHPPDAHSPIDLESIQDYIISQVSLEIHGSSSEWNVVADEDYM